MAIQDNPLTIMKTYQTDTSGKFLTLSKKFMSYMLNLLDNRELEVFLLQKAKEMGL